MTRAIFTDSDEKRWFRDEPEDEDDLVPLDHPSMREALDRYKAAVAADAARLTDDELDQLSLTQNQLRRAGGSR